MSMRKYCARCLFPQCHSIQGAVGKGYGFAHLGTVISSIWSSHVIRAVGGEICKDRTLGYVTNML